MPRCFDCNLPDPYNGAGDGIGSCECARCEYCGGPPGVCNCDEWDCDCDDYEDRPELPDFGVDMPMVRATPDVRYL